LPATNRKDEVAILRLAADENFNSDVVRGVLRRNASLDLVRVQDEGLSGTDDPAILGWSAQTGRVLLTHDARTMTRHAYARSGGQAHAGRVRGWPLRVDWDRN
jgi:hypothetical protein